MSSDLDTNQGKLTFAGDNTLFTVGSQNHGELDVNTGGQILGPLFLSVGPRAG